MTASRRCRLRHESGAARPRCKRSVGVMRLDALLGVVRAAAADLPRRYPSSECPRPGEHRGSVGIRMGTLRRFGGAIIGADHFGASAPEPIVMREFGFTPEHIVETAKALLKEERTVRS
jgi:hypothetical protein